MGALSGLNNFLSQHVWVLYSSLGFAVVGTAILYIVALVHAINGTRNPFTIAICSTVICIGILYAIHLYLVIIHGFKSRVIFFIVYASLELTYWMLAHRYLCSSILVSYKFRFIQPPQNLERSLHIALWLGIALIVVSSTFVLLQGKDGSSDKPPYTSMLLLNLLSMITVVLVMCVALYKISQVLKTIPGMDKKVKLQRMVAHSLAYILYVVSFFTFRLVNTFKYHGEKYPDMYAAFLLLTITAVIQFFFFFRILWHLGTKEKAQFNL